MEQDTTPPHRNGTVPVFSAKGESSASLRPTVADLQGDNHYAEVARKIWVNKKKLPKVQPKVVKEELWDSLEKEGFAYGSLLILETLQVLEKYVLY
jgi:intron-binding protein aquarius